MCDHRSVMAPGVAYSLVIIPNTLHVTPCSFLQLVVFRLGHLRLLLRSHSLLSWSKAEPETGERATMCACFGHNQHTSRRPLLIRACVRDSYLISRLLNQRH